MPNPIETLKPVRSQQRCMSILLVQSCSKSKNQPKEAVPALDLYSGYFFKIIKKAIDDNEFDQDIDILILSAKYGLIDADTEIGWYDQEMDACRAAELTPVVQTEFRNRVKEKYNQVIINAGKIYQRTLAGSSSIEDVDVHYIEGEGIGAKGRILKQVVRGNIEAAINQPEPEISNN